MTLAVGRTLNPKSTNQPLDSHLYAPNLEEVEGAYWFGSVRVSVHASSAKVMLSSRSGTVKARILKFGMWFVNEN